MQDGQSLGLVTRTQLRSSSTVLRDAKSIIKPRCCGSCWQNAAHNVHQPRRQVRETEFGRRHLMLRHLLGDLGGVGLGRGLGLSRASYFWVASILYVVVSDRYQKVGWPCPLTLLSIFSKFYREVWGLCSHVQDICG